MSEQQDFNPIEVRNWRKNTTGFFTAKHDPRDLWVIEHPWKPSTEGGFGSWETRVAPPPGWKPGQPLYLSFYQSDNYSGAWMESPWMGTQAFIGHRFKQLLVNRELVWESDVDDEEFTGVIENRFKGELATPGYIDPYRIVKIEHDTSDEIELVFRVFDRVASTEKLPDDAYRRFSWSACDPTEASLNFFTKCYFGDMVLLTVDKVSRPPALESSFSSRPPEKFASKKAGIFLNVVTPTKLPSPGFPVRSGVPMPAGNFASGTPFALEGPEGNQIAFVATETSHWPDGSIRWLLCEFVASRKGRYRLVPNTESSAPEFPVSIKARESTHTIINGPLTLKFSQTGQSEVVCESMATKDGIEIGPMHFQIKLNRVGWRDRYASRPHECVIERANGICAIVRIEGDMLGKDEQRFGSFRARVHIWTGLPYVVVDWRLVNESDQAMAMLLDWSARFELPDLAESKIDFGPFPRDPDMNDRIAQAMGHRAVVPNARDLTLHRDSELSCRQEKADEGRIYRNTSWIASTDAASGFVNINHSKGGICGTMRWFAEEFPTGIVVRPDMLSMGTLAEYEEALAWPHDRPHVRIGRGEAKRQTFALWLHDGKLLAKEAERFSACVHDNPRLFSESWFIESGTLDTGPKRSLKKLKPWAEKVGPEIDKLNIHFPRLGHREYWDTAWSNDYRGRTHLGLLQYVETGDPRWYRYFDAAITHNRDVDVIHYCPEHLDWVGGCHSYGEDHTSCGPMSNIGMNVDGMLEHYLMTGDTDSLETATGFAEHLLNCKVRVRSARNIGWPLAQAVRWYEQTGDERFLKRSKEFVQAATDLIEPRRGIFFEIHGCWSYRGTVPFMLGYLAFGLIRYHQSTGDESILRLLALMAEGLFAEDRTGKGRFKYSPYPENNFPSSEKVRAWNPLIGGLTGYLYEKTGSRRYREWTTECYDAILEDTDELRISSDMMPICGWMLRTVVN